MRGVTRRPGALAAALALALVLVLTVTGCAENATGRSGLARPVAPRVDPADDRPVGAVAAGVTFGTQVALGAVPPDPLSQARQVRFLADRATAVSALLAARAAAVRHHDRAAFLATVDPGDRAYVAKQAQLYAALAALPLSVYTVTEAGSGYLPPEPSTRDAGLDVDVAQVRVSFALAGFDRAATSDEYAWTLLRRDGRWRLASTTDISTVSAVHQPWDVGPVAVDREGTVLTVSNGLSAAQRRALGILATQAVTDDRRYLPRWDGRVVLFVGRDTTLFDDLFVGSTHGPDDYAGVEVPLSDPDGLVGTRVLINPDAVKLTDTSRISDEALLLRHELVHVALAPMLGPARPLWLTEGVAQWISYQPFPYTSVYESHQRARAVGTKSPPTLPTDDDFESGSDTALDAAYLDSWLVCADIVRHSGLTGLLRLYAAASALPDADAHDPAALDRVLRRGIGLTAAQLTARYRADLALRLSTGASLARVGLTPAHPIGSEAVPGIGRP